MNLITANYELVLSVQTVERHMHNVQLLVRNCLPNLGTQCFCNYSLVPSLHCQLFGKILGGKKDFQCWKKKSFLQHAKKKKLAVETGNETAMQSQPNLQ